MTAIGSFTTSYLVDTVWTYLLLVTALFSFWDGIIIALVVFLITHFLTRRKRYRASSVSVNIPFGLGNITYESTDADRTVAWKLFTQLRTRKAALIFEEEHDVVAEVYTSLYELFQVGRDLLMNLPLYEIEREPSIADLVLRVQNDGIRPHLTKWQCGFRRWWEAALTDPSNKDKTPQDIQKQFPEYAELIQELKQVNLELNKYAEQLFIIAKVPERKRPKRKPRARKPTASQPSDQPPQVEDGGEVGNAPSPPSPC